MKITRLVPSGYCKGVINAIEIARKCAKEHPNEKIYVLGMIVHNSFVTKQLSELGIITLDDTEKTKDQLLDEIEEGIVIFTAHGIADHYKEKAQKKGLKYIDASCEDVLKTREIIKKHLNNNYDVIYFGKKNHPEAEAVLSISQRIHLVTNEKDISELTIANPQLLVTNQTTMSFIELQDMFALIKEKYPQAKFIEEICNATSSRQKAIMEVSDADAIFVVGDVKSNNTAKLVDIAKTRVNKVFLISDASKIKKADLKGLENIYVTAGASTPPELIQGVIKYLKESTVN